MVFTEDGVNISDQFSRIYGLRNSRSAQYRRFEAKQHDSECAGLEGPWLHGQRSSLLHELIARLRFPRIYCRDYNVSSWHLADGIFTTMT
jgi:hypothetical protein